MPNIIDVHEGRRGCGFRSPGGIYLRCDGKGFGCGVLPIPFKFCHECGSTHAPKRSLVNVPTKFIKYCLETDLKNCDGKPSGKCAFCPMHTFLDTRPYLLVDWVGAKAYPHKEDFQKESAKMGISRRLNARINSKGELVGLPKGFEIGLDWLGLGHVRGAIATNEQGRLVGIPGVFEMYCPDRIEYVVKGDETEEQLGKLEAQGLPLVNVINPPEATQGEIFEENE